MSAGNAVRSGTAARRRLQSRLCLRERDHAETEGDVHMPAAGRHVVAKEDRPRGRGHYCPTVIHLGGQLRPRGERRIQLDRGGRAAVGDGVDTDHRRHRGQLHVAVRVFEYLGAQLAEQATEQGSGRVQVEAFDLEQTSIAGLGKHRNPSGPRVFARQNLHEGHVALLDEKIETRCVVEELVDAEVVDTVLVHQHGQVRVQLRDLSGGELGLVDTEVSHARPQSVQVRDVQLVEVGELDRAERPLRGHRERDRVAHRQTEHTNGLVREPRLFLRGDLIAVGRGANFDEFRLVQHMYEVTRPGVKNPHAELIQRRATDNLRYDVGTVGEPAPIRRPDSRQVFQLELDLVAAGENRTETVQSLDSR